MKEISKIGVVLEFEFSAWSGRVTDRDMAAKIEMENGAVAGIASFSKAIIRKERLAGIKAAIRAARADINLLTLPWKNASRLLPLANIEKADEVLEQHKMKIGREVEAFLNVYDEAIEEMPELMGELMDTSLYPTKSEIRRKFGFDYVYYPIPAGQDFGLGEMMDKAAARVDERVASGVEAAHKVLWNRLHAILKESYERIADEENNIREPTITTLAKIIESLPSLNIKGDPKFELIVAESQNLMSELEHLRDSHNDESKAKKSTAQVIKSVPGYRKELADKVGAILGKVENSMDDQGIDTTGDDSDGDAELNAQLNKMGGYGL